MIAEMAWWFKLYLCILFFYSAQNTTFKKACKQKLYKCKYKNAQKETLKIIPFINMSLNYLNLLKFGVSQI